jgi:hypothetical protein
MSHILTLLRFGGVSYYNYLCVVINTYYMNNKICTKCGIEKPLNQFSRDISSKDGVRYVCRQCISEIGRQKRIDSGLSVYKEKIINEDSMECLCCREVLPMNMFISGIVKARKYSYCSKCRNAKNDERRRKNGSEQTRRRRKNLMQRFKMSVEDYASMLESQDNKCSICGKEYISGSKRFAVDHDHSTGLVRGILCSRCNTAIGQFEDNVVLLEGAISYLKKNGGGSMEQ